MKFAITLSTLLALSPSSHSFHLPSPSLLPPSSSLLASSFDPAAGDTPTLIKNNNGDLWVPDNRTRPRRNRKSPAIRAMVRENIVTPSNFIYPLFIHEDDNQVHPILSMPGCDRHTLDSMMTEVGEATRYGVNTFVLFPKVADSLKTNHGEEVSV